MDSVDKMQVQQEEELKRMIKAARGEVPKHRSGECIDCGEWSSRLVGGVCVACRDRYERGLK